MLEQWIKDRRVCFITTKNLDYLRNVQEIAQIREQAASCRVIGSADRSYPKRLLCVYRTILATDFRAFDVVFVGFAPQLVLPFLGWKMKHCTIVEDFFISMYDTLVFDRRKFGVHSPAAAYLKHLDKKTLHRASFVIADTNAHADYFAEEFSFCRERIGVWYLQADTSVYYPRRKKPSADGSFRVLYFGSVLPLQGVDVVIQAAGLLREEEGISFEIIGPVKEKDRRESPRITYIEWLDQQTLAEHIADADLCLAGHFNSDIAKASRTIPGKAYIYRAMERPMILGENPANHELYDQTDEGIWFVKMGDPSALAAKIREIYHEKN